MPMDALIEVRRSPSGRDVRTGAIQLVLMKLRSQCQVAGNCAGRALAAGCLDVWPDRGEEALWRLSGGEFGLRGGFSSATSGHSYANISSYSNDGKLI